MSYRKLTAALAEDTGETQAAVDRVLDALTDSIRAQLYTGNDVTLPGLGRFSPVERAARKGRNPQTGAVIEIPARRAVKFTPAKALKDALN